MDIQYTTKEFKLHGRVIVHQPILTAAEHERRMNQIKRATEYLMKSVLKGN